MVPGSAPTLPLSDDFESLQENIFTPICSVCHAGANAPQGLRLDATNAYNLLVNVPSTEVPSILRVKPGDSTNSYIIQKLEGHAAVGAQMPLGGPYLTADTIAFIAQWISDGASAPAAVNGKSSGAAFMVTSIVPDNQETLDSRPPQIMVAFNHDLDITQLGTHAVHIEKMLGTETLQVQQRAPARISVSSANPRALMIWPSEPLSSGHYRIVMDAGASAQFSDIAGQLITVGTTDELGALVISTFDVEIVL